jgi:hypothetical protein
MTSASLGRPSPHHAIALEVAERWLHQLKPVPWEQRILLLNDLHQYLRDNLASLEVFCDVFPEAIALIIERLGNEPIATVGQAHVYANSLDENHRQMAKAWFKQGASSVA